MHPHRPHVAVAAALAVALCAALSPAWGQTPATASALPEARVHTDAAGNLHLTSAANRTVLINGVDYVGELAALRAVAAQLQAARAGTTTTTTTTTPGPTKVFSNSSQTRIVASDAASFEYFGRAVSISGTTLVVGAYGDDGAIGTEYGAAYVFTLINGAWVQQQKLTASDAAPGDQFGEAVDIDGDTIVVGSPWDDDAGLTNSGSAYVFQRTGTTWTQQQKLVASDAASNYLFGLSVSIDGATIVVGAHQYNAGGLSKSGAAYVFQRTGTAWAQQQKLTASDAAADDEFGISLSISGATIVVGAHQHSAGGLSKSGAAYVFTRSGTAWTQQQKLTASDGAAHDQFGWSVGISGDSIVVGVHEDDDAGSRSGSAYVFTRIGTTWSQQQKLVDPNAAPNDSFGVSVAIDGNTIVVGATGVDHSTFVTNTGAMFVFTRTGTTWSQPTKLTASPSGHNDHFGRWVAIDSNTIVAGALFSDHAGSNSGAAYVFQ